VEIANVLAILEPAKAAEHLIRWHSIGFSLSVTGHRLPVTGHSFFN
jgi:hypothetical protein